MPAPAAPARHHHHLAATKRDGAATCEPRAPSRCNLLGPQAVPCPATRAARRLRIADARSSPADDMPARSSALLARRSRLASHSLAAEDAAEDRPEEAAEDRPEEAAWPPPPVRGRRTARGHRTVSRRRPAPTPVASGSSGVVVDFPMALRFIVQVKRTCAPACFPAFLEILLEYHRGRRTVVQVYEEAAALFAAEQDGGQDVLAAFRDFLPAPDT
eukprot:COSAG06_NODE_3372_length_5435_cov_3.871627_7_plen_216_part_00